MWTDQIAPGTIIGGDFLIERFLKGGGMGDVYVARQISTDKQRAIKIMQSHLTRDPKMQERFKQEAKVGARIRSPHVVEVVGAGIDEQTSRPWLAMELLDGWDLKTRVEKEGPLSTSEMLLLFEQLCRALAEAHKANVVHRDLKPENIFLSSAPQMNLDLPFSVKVLDFGIAKMVADFKSQSAGTMQLGTPLWMAPEQMDSARSITPATDIWPLGLLAFWLITGRIYFRSGNQHPVSLASVMAEVITSELIPASRRADEIGASGRLPAGFDAWFARCVCREAEGRFRNATEVFEGLLALYPGHGKMTTGGSHLPYAHSGGSLPQPLALPRLVSMGLAGGLALFGIAGLIWIGIRYLPVRKTPSKTAAVTQVENKPVDPPPHEVKTTRNDSGKIESEKKSPPPPIPPEPKKPRCENTDRLLTSCEQNDNGSACVRLANYYERGKCAPKKLCMAHGLYKTGCVEKNFQAACSEHKRFHIQYPNQCIESQ